MWPKICLRALALANAAFALLGAYNIQVAITAFPSLQGATLRSSASTDFPYLSQVFGVMTLICVLLLVALLITGYYVWCLSPIGHVTGNVVYVAEVAYWLLSTYGVRFALTEWGSGPILNSIAAAGPLANAGLLVQFRVWYPLIAVVLLEASYLQRKAWLPRAGITRTG
jgi:hypothetical protein